MNSEKGNNFKELLKEEMETRICEIESPDYEYVPRLKKGDYIGMVVTGAICIAIIIIGII